MNISLCITTYNKPKVLEKVLQAAFRMHELPREILVCDDGSGEETKQLIDRLTQTSPVPLRHLWQPDEGWRVSKARNMGISNASGDYLVFIDGDCVPHRKFVADHHRLAEEDCLVLGDRSHVVEGHGEHFDPRLLPVLRDIYRRRLRKRYTAIRRPWARIARYAMDDLTPLGLAELTVGCNMAFWKRDAERVNGFNEAMKGWCLEDVEMAARLLACGVEAKKIQHKAIVYHLDHGDPVYDKAAVFSQIEAVFSTREPLARLGLK